MTTTQEWQPDIEECISCEEDPEPDNPDDLDGYKCPKSKRLCGHHCNHVWTSDSCCWCGWKLEESAAEGKAAKEAE